MEAIEKIIWNYIDGTLTESQTLETKQKIETDPNYKSAYAAAISLADNLKDLKVEKAPDFLASNIMVSIKNVEIYSAPETSFAGIKYVIGLMLGLGAILSLIVLSSAKAAIAAPSKWDITGNLTRYMTNKTGAIQVPEVPSLMAESLPYATVFGILLFVFWVDIYYNKLKLSKARK